MRGVKNVEVNERICEAVVTRRRGEAPNPALLSALDTIGYPGALLPIEDLGVEVKGLEDREGRGRLCAALRQLRGVRRIQIVVGRGANVSLDRRVNAPADLVTALAKAGFEAQLDR